MQKSYTPRPRCAAGVFHAGIASRLTAAAAMIIVVASLAAAGQADPSDDGTIVEGLPCGPASMAAVMTAFDTPFRNVELAAIADEDGLSSMADLRAFAREHGLFAQGVELTPSELVELDHVAILHLKIPDAATDEIAPHFVAYFGRGEDRLLAMADPTGVTPLNGRVEPDAVFDHWTGRALLVSDTPLPLGIDPAGWLRHWGPRAGWVVGAIVVLGVVVVILRRMRHWREAAGLSSSPA